MIVYENHGWDAALLAVIPVFIFSSMVVALIYFLKIKPLWFQEQVLKNKDTKIVLGFAMFWSVGMCTFAVSDFVKVLRVWDAISSGSVKEHQGRVQDYDGSTTWFSLYFDGDLRVTSVDMAGCYSGGIRKEILLNRIYVKYVEERSCIVYLEVLK